MKGRTARPMLALLSALLCGVALVSGWLAWQLLRESGPGDAAATRTSWRPGQVYSYDIRWRQHSRSANGLAPGLGLPASLEGSVVLAGTLLVAPGAADGGSIPLRLGFHSISEAGMEVLGTDVLAEPTLRAQVLAPRMAEAELGIDGELRRLRLPKDAPEPWAQLIEGVVLSLQNTSARGRPSAGGSRPMLEERAPDGVFEVRYEHDGDRGLRRTRQRALAINGRENDCTGSCQATLVGSAALRFDASGSLTSIRQQERIQVREGAVKSLTSDLSFTATLRDVRPARQLPRLWPVVAEDELTVKEPGHPWESADSARQDLVRRAAGMTADDVATGLDLTGALGSDGLPRGWLSRATAFLSLHPEQLEGLAARFDDPARGRKGRLAILDVLAATGTPAAQKVLRALLDRTEARRHELDPDERVVVVQRTMLLERPEPATIAYLQSRFEASQSGGDRDLALASAFALGAAASHPEAQSSEAGRAAAAVLRRALGRAHSPQERAGLVRALGNAGHADAVASIVAEARSPDETVRAAAASALRKTATPAAQSALVALVSDSAPGVRLAAIDALAQQTLPSTVTADLAHLLPRGGLDSHAESELVTLLSRQGPPGPGVREALSHLLARTEDNRLRARIAALLGPG